MINCGIVGCGAIFPQHANAIKSSSFANLVAVCDIDGERAKTKAHEYWKEDVSEELVCKSFSDYSEFLACKEIEVVHICTPHYLHAPMAIAAMRAGKHVLTEKPIAMNSAEAREMIKVSNETGITLGVCFQNRYNPTSIRIKELLESGELGKVIGAKAFVTWHRTKEYYTNSGWRGTWEKEGGGVLINQAIHTLDLVQWFLGMPDKIKAHVATTLLDGVIEVEDTANATMMVGDVPVLFYATNCYVENSPVEIEIICEKGKIHLRKDLTVTYKDGKVEHLDETGELGGMRCSVKASSISYVSAEKSYWGRSHAALIEEFYSCLRDGRQFMIPGDEAIKAIDMIDMIYSSSTL